jgi:hypothetical protein
MTPKSGAVKGTITGILLIRNYKCCFVYHQSDLEEETLAGVKQLNTMKTSCVKDGTSTAHRMLPYKGERLSTIVSQSSAMILPHCCPKPQIY